MVNVPEVLDNITLKINQLALKIERLKEENIALKEENAELMAELDAQKSSVGALKEKLSVTQKVMDQQKENEVEHSKQLKDTIDQYIVELDKCIEWLHNN